MDVNKEVDRLEKAVARNDIDEAVRIDTNLAVYEQVLVQGLQTMPREHSETMSFYFRDWIMNLVDEIIFIAVIIIAFNIENEFFSIILGGLGAFMLVVTFFSRRQYVKFLSGDLWRMRKEKMLADNYKLQLNYIRKTRTEHTDFIEKALNKTGENLSFDSIIDRILNIPLDTERKDDDNEKT